MAADRTNIPTYKPNADRDPAVARDSYEVSRTDPFMREPIKFDYDIDDIIAMSVGMCSGITDTFELQTRHRPTLPFDRANLGKPISATKCRFLNTLPIEIITKIVSFLPAGESLNNLAMVSRDLRVLARTIQFESVLFDYTDLKLVLGLAEEMYKATSTHLSSPETLLLGPSIRRLRVNTHSGAFNWRHDLTREHMNDLPISKKAELYNKALNAFFGHYLPVVLEVIQHCLPNLELFEWSDRVKLPGGAWAAILRSPARHLRLFRTTVDETVFNELQSLPLTIGESVETLDMELMDDHGKGKTSFTYDFGIELLNRCSHGVRALVWNGDVFPAQLDERRAGTLLEMPELRSLTLRFLQVQSEKDMRSLISPHTTSKPMHLSLSMPNEIVANRLRDVGNMPALTSFVWRPSLNGPALPINFLRHNPQLELLSLDNCSLYDIDQVVLPLLVSRFDRLKSLELVYAVECTELTKAALSHISCLKSLTQLHLQLGFPVGWR